MTEAIEILKRQGAEIVDPADIPSIVAKDPSQNFALWGQCSGVNNSKGKDSDCSVVLKYGMKRDFNAWLATLGASAPVKSLTGLREWNITHTVAGAIRYGQSQLDISDEMDVQADRARYEADRAKDILLAGTHGIDAGHEGQPPGRDPLSGSERRGHRGASRLSDGDRAVRHGAQRTHPAIPAGVRRQAAAVRSVLHRDGMQRAAPPRDRLRLRAGYQAAGSAGIGSVKGCRQRAGPPLSQTGSPQRHCTQKEQHMRRILMAVLVALAPAAAQTSFEVASVRISQFAKAGGEGSTRESVEPGPGGLAMRNVSLRSAIRWAYGVKDFQISAPGWTDSERYDIAAKAAGAVSNEQLRLMLQALLTERFKLALHHETKELPVYALVVGKRGTRIEAAKSAGDGVMRVKNGALEFRSMSMAEFAERLSARPFGVERPVVDRTGLEGAFDFTMKLAENDVELKRSLERREMEHDSSMFTAPLQELGLKLEAQKGPIEILVIDRADKVPVEN